MKRLKLLLILCLSFSLPANGMQLPSLPTYINKNTISVIGLIITFMWLKISTIKKLFTKELIYLEDINFNIPDSIKKLIEKEAEKKGLKNIRVGIDKIEPDHGYWANTQERIIFLSENEVKELNTVLTPPHSSKPTDTFTLNAHGKNLLNGHIASINHELTHIERESENLYVISDLAGSIASSIAYHKLFGKYAQIAFSIPYTLGAMLATHVASSTLLHFYAQYEELCADDGIPDKIELLKASANQFKQRQEFCIKTINQLQQKSLAEILSTKRPRFFNNSPASHAQLLAAHYIPIKYFETSPLLCDLVINAKDTHPSDLRRELRFRARIAAIEATEKSAQNK